MSGRSEQNVARPSLPRSVLRTSPNDEVDLAGARALMPSGISGFSEGRDMSELQDIGSLVSAPVETKSERSWVVLKQTVLVAALILLPLFYTLVPPLEDYPN